jgi:4'-phosphopantetheinyl transferase
LEGGSLPLVHRDLTDAEGHLYWLDPVALGANPASAARAGAWLDEGERARHATFAGAAQRLEFLAAHALLRATLSRYAAAPPEGWRFVHDARGRPSLAPEHACDWLRFSLSHTAGLVVVLVARDRAVGVDAEDRERRVDRALVARRYFSSAEAAGIEALATEELRRERFFALWTLKEAWLKAQGLGLAGGLDGVVVQVDEVGGDVLLEPRTAWPGGRPAWALARFRPTPRHRIAACVARARGDGPCAWVTSAVDPGEWVA